MRSGFPPIGRLSINSVIAILTAATLLSIFQRAFFRRSALKPVSVALGSSNLPSDFKLRIFKVTPEAYAEDTYQLAYIVQSLRPDSVLEARRLVDGPAGQVAIGLADGRWPELHTCLMESGRGAVTNQRMVKENLLFTDSAPNRRSIRILKGVLLGHPLTSRPCLFVQLRLNEVIADSQASRVYAEERLLKEAWPVLKSLAPLREREFF